MRVSSLQIFQNGVRNIQTGQTNIANLQNQISTGKKLISPADDPVAAAQILKLQRELTTTQTYNENITVSERRLSLEEQTLQQIQNASDRVRELAIQANNGALTDADRKGIAGEIREMQTFIQGLMNTRDAQGEYLFAGAKGKTQPFSNDGSGVYAYNGDDETRLIQVGPEVFTQSTDSGRDIFQTIQVAAANVQAPAPAGYSVSVSEPEVFRNYVNSNGRSDLTLEVVAGTNPGDPATYTLLDSDGNPVKGTSGNNLSGTVPDGLAPVTLDLSLEIGLSFAVTPPAGGSGTTDDLVFTPDVPRRNILTSIENLIVSLEAGGTADEVNQAVTTALDELEQGQEGIISAQTQMGGRLSTLENQRTINEDFEIFTKAALSNLEDLDYAEAISAFSFQEVALQAAQQTFARVNNLTLFNFL
ncbi:flagellar hook-associated protein FlgL [Motiliproteus sp.]|uniref:flagellar hook-associated protein FlgL n=1 Tax=Motiliproteus sp. TaxID=1898955 RepID=UPI003BABC99E